MYYLVAIGTQDVTQQGGGSGHKEQMQQTNSSLLPLSHTCFSPHFVSIMSRQEGGEKEDQAGMYVIKGRGDWSGWQEGQTGGEWVG